MFNNELHEQLFALFIAESNSASYRLWDFNTKQKMIQLIYLITNEYELMWLDRCYHEPFYSEVIRMVKESK